MTAPPSTHIISTADCTEAARSNGSDSPAVLHPLCLRAVTAISPSAPTSLSSTAPPLNAHRPARCPVIGIVGGVGSGKSSVIATLAGLPVHVIDADRIGHQQLLVPTVRSQLIQHFGPQITATNGEIDRPKLAALVFGNSPAQQASRQALNRIVQPGIQAEILHQISNTPQSAKAIVLDAALLLEAGWHDHCDATIFIETPLELRQQRVAASRGWSPEELHRRELSQWPLEQKRAACSHSIDNSGSPNETASQLQSILKQILGFPLQQSP